MALLCTMAKLPPPSTNNSDDYNDAKVSPHTLNVSASVLVSSVVTPLDGHIVFLMDQLQMMM